ncbi:MAG: hypothetical protein OHK93_001617 [Ramalina farinacea]|uniref:Uncharacterized protein n=1 Tax=Ramalina farinacea TaxID=258253 RepID=A0AA43QRW7_9LECA|nr:hypothetical protein [Ramalina farinacea]
MQSILQYRRFGRHVQKQYERDQGKAQALHVKDDGAESSSSSSASNDRDIEKSASDKPTHLRNAEEDVPTASEQLPPLTPKVTTGTALGTTLTGISVRDRTKSKGEGDSDTRVFVVGYEGPDDVLNPHNWSKVTRIGATVNIAFIGWIVGFASSVDSAALKQASAEFGVSEVTESLATGLFLIGFGVGALFAGPVSETVGRNPVYIATLTLYMIFIMASGLAPNIGSQFVFRFIAGLFGATPLTCAGGSISDLWDPLERVYAFPVFANAAGLVSWRWTEWVTLIISGLVLALVILFQPETYAPVLLAWKSKKLRELTGDERFKAEIEIRDESFATRLGHSLYRPFVLTFTEPIIVSIALYLTVIYIILFTFLNGYTFIFTETYGFSEGITGLSFIGIGIGLCLASCLVPVMYIWAKRALAKAEAQGGSRLPPEFRLWFAMLGAPAIPISLLWMGWTTYPSISYWSPLAASVLFGYGILCVFISSYQYLIDGYEKYAASALASVTLIRYVAAGGMVEVAIPFYKNLGVHWTLTILACLSALLVPVPYLFYLYGPKIRKRSKHAVA